MVCKKGSLFPRFAARIVPGKIEPGMQQGPTAGKHAGQQSHRKELGALAPGHLGPRGAIDAHHRRFPSPLVLGGNQRRIQHQ